MLALDVRLGTKGAFGPQHIRADQREALKERVRAETPEDAVWYPTDKQQDFLAAEEFEVLYGGAAGGGKTDGLLIDSLGISHGGITKRAYQAIIFRRTFPDLKDIIDRSHELFPLAVSAGKPKYDKQAHVWTFPSGARIEFGYIQRDAERFRYRGRAFQYVGWEELTLWPTEVPYRYLLSRVRSKDRTIPLYVRSTTNPDGPGFQWVKTRWQIPTDGRETVLEYELHDPESGETFKRKRRFIPAKLKDNPHLGADYRLNLLEGDEDEQNALLRGLWMTPKVRGAYFATEMLRAHQNGRITTVPYVRSIPVNTFWDLGANDTTAIWCHQLVAMQHRFLKCYEASGEGLDHFVQWLVSTGFTFGTHYLPHDAEHKKLGMRDTRSNLSMLQELMPGHRFVVVPRIDDVNVGINITRGMIDQCCFDREGTAGGLAALENYRKEWDEDHKTFRNHPLHDWSSNYADAFRQFGQGFKVEAPFRPTMKTRRPADRGVGY